MSKRENMRMTELGKIEGRNGKALESWVCEKKMMAILGDTTVAGKGENGGR